LPNPWGPRSGASTTGSGTNTTSGGSGGSAPNPTGMPSLAAMNNIFAQLTGGANSNPSTTTTSTTTSSTATPTTNPSSTTSGSGGGGAGGLFGSNFVQDYVQQIMQNPRQMESMLNTPYMQSMLQTIASNPDLARVMTENSPQLAGNPELREQVNRAMPAMLQQVYIIYYII
jgi:ubiquilin